MRVGVDAEHEVAEGAVDVLAAALHGRLVGRVDDIDCHGAGDDVVGSVEGVEVAVTRSDHVGVGPVRDQEGRPRGGGRCRLKLSCPWCLQG